MTGFRSFFEFFHQTEALMKDVQLDISKIWPGVSQKAEFVQFLNSY